MSGILIGSWIVLIVGLASVGVALFIGMIIAGQFISYSNIVFH